MPRSAEKFDAVAGRKTSRLAPFSRRDRFDIPLGGSRCRLGERTIICGIVNVTPDSFSDGGRYLDPERAILHALDMAREGADWIDVGGESTRPGASPVTLEEELRRVLPVVRGIRRWAPELPISIDTTKAVVAAQAIRAGASLINDISGLRFDPAIAEVARSARVPLVLMHLRGRPATMQRGPFAREIFRSLFSGLRWSVERALAMGVRRSQLIVDPGLGFGKAPLQNFEIMAGLGKLRRLRLPILVGASRKSFVRLAVCGGHEPVAQSSAFQKLCGLSHAQDTSRGDTRLLRAISSHARTIPDRRRVTRRPGNRADLLPADLDFADAAAVAGVILAGAHVVRVHNVRAARAAARIADAILAAARE